MRYVLDSSVALKTALPETDSAKAIALCEAFEKGQHELFSPDIYPIESAHALTKAERRGLLKAGDAAILFADLPIPVLHPSLPLLQRAIEISSSNRVGMYDCLYVALAEQENCELVTADQRLVNSLSGQFAFIIGLDAIP
jgi:predicted nucleic acid-binding protein